jgi:hypothetical protein
LPIAADWIAKKIKADLIERAKIKQSFAKVLKAEGMSSDRLARNAKGKERAHPDTAVHADNVADHDAQVLGNDATRKRKALTVPTASGQVRALSPSDIGPPMPQSSFRDLKKEAFKKFHPARQKGGGVLLGSAAERPGKPSRGQPNMGARMGVLLETIKLDRAR